MVNTLRVVKHLDARLIWAVLLVGLVLVALLTLTLLAGGHPHMTQTAGWSLMYDVAPADPNSWSLQYD